MNIFKPEPWTENAACHQYTPDDWFAKENTAEQVDALKVCKRCDVRDQCLSYALRMGEEFGIWGGATEATRRALSRKGAAA